MASALCSAGAPGPRCVIGGDVGEGNTPYREIGRRALALTLERAEIPHTQDEVRTLVAQIERLRPFEDVVPALTRLRARYQLVILSNGDPDMLENAKPYIGFELALVSPTGHATSALLTRVYVVIQAYAALRFRPWGQWEVKSGPSG